MNKNRLDLALKAAIGALLTALVVIVALGVREPRVIEAGDTAPDFTITTDQGQKISPTNFGGRVLVLHFWASWCGPCIEEAPALNDFTRKVAGSGVVVVGLSIDSKEEAYKRFIQKYQVAFQTARDPDSNISASYGTFKVPETYIIDRSGKVVQKIIAEGNWTDPAMVNFVKSL